MQKCAIFRENDAFVIYKSISEFRFFICYKGRRVTRLEANDFI